MEWTKTKIIGASVAGLVAIGLIAGTEEEPTGGDGGGKASQVQTEQASAKEPAEVLEPSLELDAPEPRSVTATQVKLTGSLDAEDGTPGGATVKVDGKTAALKDGRWSKTVQLKRGKNDFIVAATKAGYEGASTVVSVTRKRTPAEIAAAVAKRKADYIAGAQSLPYNQLEKNPDRHAGKRVVYRGQIMQIQEDFGSSVILLSVTDEGYGFWTDNVWVDYEGTINGAEDDIITVYGVIEGTKSYETQIGGETYVPQMTAKYVVE